MRIGLFLSSEEFGPRELVDLAIRGEQAGFSGLWISDHYHPWIDEQGHSPFVWSTIGAIAQATDLPLGTGVTCPTIRMHPAIVAHAAATSAILLEGRFTFGVGSGEALNEHVLGDRWPTADERLEMLEEAVDVMRKLWTGEVVDHHGRHYTVENARIYDTPDTPPPVLVSGFGPKAIRLAARIGEGFVTTSPLPALRAAYASLHRARTVRDKRIGELDFDGYCHVFANSGRHQDLAHARLGRCAAALPLGEDPRNRRCRRLGARARVRARRLRR